MGSVYHHPAESFICLLCLACLANRSPNLRSNILLLLDDVLLPKLKFESSLTGVCFYCDVASKERKAVQYLGNCKWPSELLPLCIRIDELVLLQDLLCQL
jgi:hypothetical protein